MHTYHMYDMNIIFITIIIELIVYKIIIIFENIFYLFITIDLPFFNALYDII